MADVPQGGDQRVLDAGNPSILPFPKPNKITPEVKTQPLAAQGSETDHQAWNKLIGMRTEQHDPALIQQQPMLVAGMVTSGIEDHVHQHLATHLPKVLDWVGAKTAVADITGGVAAIQASALNASDPVIRQDQLQFAKNLQALPTPEQQLLISYLSNPKELLTSTQQTSLSKALTTTVPELQRQLLGNLKNAETSITSGILGNFHPGDWLSWLENAQSGAGSSLQNAAPPEVQQSGTVGQVAYAVNKGFSESPYALFGLGIDELGQFSAHAPVLSSAGFGNTVSAISTLDTKYGPAAWLTSATDAVGGEISKSQGYAPGSYQADQTNAAVGNFLMLVTFHVLSEGSAAIKGTATTPADMLTETDPAAAVNASVSSATPGEIGFHPQRVIADPLLRGAINKALGVTAEDWAAGNVNLGQRFLEGISGTSSKGVYAKVADIIDANPDNALGALKTGFGGTMAEPLAQTLIDTGGDITKMPQAVMDYIDGTKTLAKDIASQKDLIVKSDAIVKDLTSQLDQATKPLPSSVDLAKGTDLSFGTRPTGVTTSPILVGEKAVFAGPPANPTGYVALTDMPNGDLQISGTEITAAAARGNGLGQAMYVRAAEEAAQRGGILESDNQITPDAQRVWDALKKKGYNVGTGEDGRLTLNMQDTSVQVDPKLLDQLDSINAQKIVAQAKLLELQNTPNEPFMQFPKYSTARAALYGEVTSPLERIYKWLANPTGRGEPWMAKFVDNLPSRTFYNPDPMISKPADWQDQMTTSITRQLSQLGVDQTEISRILTDYSAVKTSADFKTFLQDNYYPTIDRALPSDIPAELRRKLTSYSNRGTNEWPSAITVTGTDSMGNSISTQEPVIPGAKTVNGEWTAISSTPTEDLQNVHFQDIQSIRDATSTVRRWQTRWVDGNIYQKLGRGVLYVAPKMLAKVGGMLILRPLYFITHLPQIMMRVQISQALATGMLPDVTNTLTIPDAVKASIPTPETLGSTLSGAFEDTGPTEPVNIPTSSFLRDNAANPPAKLWQALQEDVSRLTNDPVRSQYVQMGLDEAKFKTALTGGDSGLTNWRETVLDPKLARAYDGAGMSLDQWLSREKTLITQQTFGGNPQLLDLVSRGTLKVGSNVPEDLSMLPASAEEIQNYRMAQDSVTTVRDQLQRIPRTADNLPSIRILQDELNTARAQVDAFEAQHTLGTEGFDSLYVDGSNSKAIQSWMRKSWQNNELTLPDNVSVSRSTGTGTGLLDHLDRAQRAFNNAVYRGVRVGSKVVTDEAGNTITIEPRYIGAENMGKIDRYLTRGSLYGQRYQQYYDGLIQSGYDARTAAAWADVKSGQYVRDVSYNIQARTSFDQSVKNMFWFEPATTQTLYRFLYRVPSENFLPIGLGLEVAKAANYVSLFSHLGLIHKTPDGQMVLQYGSLGPALNKLTNGYLNLPPEANVSLSGFVPQISNPLANPYAPFVLSPGAGWIINEAASKFGGVFRDIGLKLQPYGDTNGGWPTAKKYLAELLGLNPGFLDVFSSKADNQQWAHSQSEALRYSWVDMYQAGDINPFSNLAKYGLDPSSPNFTKTDTKVAEAKLAADYKAWLGRLTTGAQAISRGVALSNLLGSTVLPTNISYTSKQQDAYQTWFKKEIVPKEVNGQLPSNYSELLAQFRQMHPDSLPFTLSYNEYSGKPVVIPPTVTDAQLSEYEYLAGLKNSMSPTDYAYVLGAFTSKMAYQSALNQSLSTIAPGTDPNKIAAGQLSNWGQRALFMNKERADYQFYLDMLKKNNPDAYAVWTKYEGNKSNAFSTTAPSTVAQTWLSDTVLKLNVLSPAIGGTNTVPAAEVTKTLADLKVQLSQVINADGGFVSGTTPVQQAQAQYFNKYLVPYIQQTNVLYNQAAALTASGANAGAVYNQITAVQQAFNGGKPFVYKGVTFPTAEQFFWGEKNPVQQQDLISKWTANPISWLTEFQRGKVGYPTFTGDQQFWTTMNTMQQEASTQLATLTPGSTQYDAAKAADLKWEQNYAASVGPQAASAFALDQAPAYVRLRSTGFATSDPYIQQLFTSADQAVSAIQASGSSISGYSTYSISVKTWLYNQIIAASKTDPNWEKNWSSLEAALPAAGNTTRTGSSLYEAIFFNQWDPKQIDKSLVALGDQIQGTLAPTP